LKTRPMLAHVGKFFNEGSRRPAGPGPVRDSFGTPAGPGRAGKKTRSGPRSGEKPGSGRPDRPVGIDPGIGVLSRNATGPGGSPGGFDGSERGRVFSFRFFSLDFGEISRSRLFFARSRSGIGEARKSARIISG
jgi:hypothetical protein